jgi:HlyD family secretion protein
MEKELLKLRIERDPIPVKPRRNITRWLAVAVFACVLIGAVVFAYTRITAPVGVEVFPVPQRGQGSAAAMPDTVLAATGYIIAAHKIEVAAKVAGKVAWIGVEKGGMVTQGQVLVRLEDAEYRAQVVQAQANVENLEAKLAELERGSRPQEIAKAKADFESARADLINYELTLKRTRTLVGDGVLARQTLDDVQDRYDAQVGKVSSLEQSYELEKLGPREEEIASMRAQLDQANGAFAYAVAQLEGTIIRAPVSGTILERNVEKGEFVTTGFVGDKGAKGYVVSLANLNDLQVELDIDQNNFAKLKPVQPAVITTDAYPDRKYFGRIEEVSPQADRQKATIQLKVKIENPDSCLRPDMNASVAFRDENQGPSKLSNSPVAVFVPLAAVRNNNEVFAVEGDQVHTRRVAVGTKHNGNAEITSGLEGGEEVVLNPPAGLKDGDKIHVKGGP